MNDSPPQLFCVGRFVRPKVAVSASREQTIRRVMSPVPVLFKSERQVVVGVLPFRCHWGRSASSFAVCHFDCHFHSQIFLNLQTRFHGNIGAPLLHLRQNSQPPFSILLRHLEESSPRVTLSQIRARRLCPKRNPVGYIAIFT